MAGATTLAGPRNGVLSLLAGSSCPILFGPGEPDETTAPHTESGRRDDSKEGSSVEAPSIPDHGGGRRCRGGGGRRLGAGRLPGIAGDQARHLVPQELPGVQQLGGPGGPPHRHCHRRTGDGARVQRGGAHPGVRGVRRGLGRHRRDVLFRRVLLCGKIPGVQLLHRGAVRDDPPRGVGVAPLPRWAGSLGGSPRRVRHGAVRRPLHRIGMGGWADRRIASVGDFRGLRFHMPGLGGEVLRALGVAARNYPSASILPALRSGTLDGAEWFGPWIDLSAGFHHAVKHYHWRDPRAGDDDELRVQQAVLGEPLRRAPGGHPRRPRGGGVPPIGRVRRLEPDFARYPSCPGTA